MNISKPQHEDDFNFLIQERIKNFWGYGSLESETWFVGMEEGLDAKATKEDLIKRFKSAHGRQTVDMRHDMQEVLDHIQWFKPNPKIQQTWRYPIALYLYLKNKRMPTTEEIRKYQSESIGNTLLKETVAIELMPLPSNKAHQSTWKYGDVGIVGLSTRDEYLKTHKGERVKKLTELVKKHNPKYVIFYSLTYLNEWTEVIGVKPKKVAEGMYITKVNETLYCVIPQGSSPGMSYKRIEDIGKKLLKHIE